MRTISILGIVLAAALSTTAIAQNARYGDWVVDSNGTATEAYTVNESGSILGFICVIAIDRCTFYISAHTSCDQGSSSTILINSDAGALTSTVTCTKMGDSYYNAIQDSTDLDGAVAKSTSLGIAIPMASGYFKVVRFSLNGANTATGIVANQAVELERDRDHMQ